MPRTYVDNAYNRSVGRVGMTVGSMVISRGSSGGGSSSSGSSSASASYSGSYSGSYGGSYSGSYSGATATKSSSSHTSAGSSGKTYVDNAYNRSVGRVGMQHGSAVISKSSSSVSGVRSDNSSGSPRTYVDNAYNRSAGRVGMAHGSAVISKSSSSVSSMSGSPRTYVDNAYNRSKGRVGMSHGSMVVSKSDSSSRQTMDSGTGARPKTYVDNKLNRSLGRVGKPLGSAVHSKSGVSRVNSGTEGRTYVDNAMNRSLGRVGEPLGSMPCSRVSRKTHEAREAFDELQMAPYDHYEDIGEGVDDDVMDEAMTHINRMLEEMRWREESKIDQKPRTSKSVLEDYTGTKVDFEDIELRNKIGQGGFGDVYFAKWQGTVVAVKKLRVQRVSKKRLAQFTDEVLTFCGLDHPNIVKFLGACVVTPNLCIVMEYMQMSLFDALHMSDTVDFSEDERLSIMQQTTEGLEYLHGKQIAHCDLKSQNVLLDYVAGETCVAKITDFGLSMIKSDTETSSSTARELVHNIGTPRYSAPEVLRGEMLSVDGMMKADIWSVSLIVYEVVYEEEPYYNYNYSQLQKHVGEDGRTPEIPDGDKASREVTEMMNSCWQFSPDDRPLIATVCSDLATATSVYEI